MDAPIGETKWAKQGRKQSPRETEWRMEMKGRHGLLEEAVVKRESRHADDEKMLVEGCFQEGHKVGLLQRRDMLTGGEDWVLEEVFKKLKRFLYS